jgi:mRNA interferase YafQ
MRTIERSSAFRRDYKRAKAMPRHSKGCGFARVSQNNRDHVLRGDWLGYRDCHLKPDLLLIYRKPSADTLLLARLGSHSERFG